MGLRRLKPETTVSSWHIFCLQQGRVIYVGTPFSLIPRRSGSPTAKPRTRTHRNIAPPLQNPSPPRNQGPDPAGPDTLPRHLLSGPCPSLLPSFTPLSQGWENRFPHCKSIPSHVLFIKAIFVCVLYLLSQKSGRKLIFCSCLRNKMIEAQSKRDPLGQNSFHYSVSVCQGFKFLRKK